MSGEDDQRRVLESHGACESFALWTVRIGPFERPRRETYSLETHASCLNSLDLSMDRPSIWEVLLNWFTYVTLVAWLVLVAVWLYRTNERLYRLSNSTLGVLRVGRDWCSGLEEGTMERVLESHGASRWNSRYVTNRVLKTYRVTSHEMQIRIPLWIPLWILCGYFMDTFGSQA